MISVISLIEFSAMRTFLLLVHTQYSKMHAGRQLVWMGVLRKSVLGIGEAEFLINAGNCLQNGAVTVQPTSGVSVDAVFCVHLNGIDVLEASFCPIYSS